MIYRWTWDNLKDDEQRVKYGRDGCTCWYPGHMFVAPWTYGVDSDPGLPGFLYQHKQIFKDNSEARSKRFSNLMICLMADDIEASKGFDPEAARLPDEMARLVQFFNSEFPTPEGMYAKRGTLAQEARAQEKKAE
eukprot:12309228-Heterocapsa_arctica.AAC.1